MSGMQSAPSLEQLAKLRHYQAPNNLRASWQVASTFGPYLLLLAAMYFVVHISVWASLVLAVPTAGLVVRIFMLQHDCGHNSLFGSSRVNRIVGAVCSLVTLTPFAYWRRLHARHHGSWNNLDARGIPADFYSDCLTVAEYGALSSGGRRLYRFSHHPMLTHLLLPPIIFLILYRVPFDMPRSFTRERRSVYWLDAGLVLLFGASIEIFGLHSVMLVQLPVIAMSAIVGIWLFSVQHRFEQAQWTTGADWSLVPAALQGVSHLQLPALLRWMSASIGVHHVHHLRPGIPNYALQACHAACPGVTGAVTTLTLGMAIKAPSYVLWDEAARRMVPFPTGNRRFRSA